MKQYYLKIIIITAFAGVLFGYGTGIMSGAILFISKEFQLLAGMNGIVVGSVLMGAVLGVLISGLISDSLGHKRLLIIAAFIFFVISLETALSRSLFWLIIGRGLIGVAIGIISYIAPLYISEIAPPQKRGALVSLNQLAIVIGILLSYIVAYYCSAKELWRWMLGLGSIPAGLFLLGILYLPHSPRWALVKGFEKDAKKILQQIRGDKAQIDKEFEEIKNRLKEDVKDWKVLFSNKIRPVLWLGMGLSIIQQVTGINTIFYYAPTILTKAFNSEIGALSATTGIGVIFLIFTIVSILLIDKIGRRPLLLGGLIGMSIGLAILCWYFGNSHAQGTRWLLITGLGFYIISFAISLGPITWLIISEIYPLKIRGIGASFATAANWTSNVLITTTFLSLVETINISGAFFVYLFLCFFSLAFVYFIVPETKGIPLEKIEEHLMTGKSLRKLGI